MKAFEGVPVIDHSTGEHVGTTKNIHVEDNKLVGKIVLSEDGILWKNAAKNNSDVPRKNADDRITFLNHSIETTRELIEDIEFSLKLRSSDNGKRYYEKLTSILALKKEALEMLLEEKARYEERNKVFIYTATGEPADD